MSEAVGQFRSETVVAIDAVKRALAIAAHGAGDVTTKAGRDIVTTADVAVEDAVREIIAVALKAPVVGAERGGEAAADGAPYWLVDPICGTRNFASGIPLYSVNLALVENGKVTAAVARDPSTGEIDVAERGRGTWSLRDGVCHRLNASDENLIVVVEDGKATGARRDQAARFTAAVVQADRRRWPRPTSPPAASPPTWSSGSPPSTRRPAAC